MVAELVRKVARKPCKVHLNCHPERAEVGAQLGGIGAPVAVAEKPPRGPELVLPQRLTLQGRDVPICDLSRDLFEKVKAHEVKI